MKKALIVSTVSKQFYLFEKGNIEVLKSLGYEIHAAANYSDRNKRLNTLDIIEKPFDIQRSPFALKNIVAYIQLKRMMKKEKYDIIHCHSPVGGVLGRLAAKSAGVNTVIYTAHGFHFYKGAALLNWLLYYPVEKYLSKYTDKLLTINMEDYKRAKKMNAKNTFLIPGVGINLTSINNLQINEKKKRKELQINENTIVLLSVGELNDNKNHETIIKSIGALKELDFKYIICGTGPKKNRLKKLARSHGVSNKIKLLGFRNDILEICKISDIFIFPSFREGLSVSLMEAMGSGLPVVASKIRGNVDLVDEGLGGYLHEANDVNGFEKSIRMLINDTEKRLTMKKHNMMKIKNMDVRLVKSIVKDVYTF